MATAAERVKNQTYQELSKLVMGTEEDLNKWRQKKIAEEGSKLTKGAKITQYQKFLAALERLEDEIKKQQRYYQNTVSKWNRPEGSWTDFPNMYKEYREKIYNLENLQADVISFQQNSRNTVTTKPGWLKKIALPVGIFGAGAATMFGLFKMSSKEGVPQGGDKPDQAITRTVDTPTQAAEKKKLERQKEVLKKR